MKQILLLLSLVVLPAALLFADDAAARSAFSSPPSRSVAAALKRGTTEKKRVLVFVTDPKKQHAVHLKATMGSEETKKLVKEHFVVVLTDFKDKQVAGGIKDVNPEHPAYVLMKPDGTVIEQGDAAMGAANGLNLVKKWVADP